MLVHAGRGVTVTWIDYSLGVLLAIGLLYLFYLADRAFVYRKQRLGFWAHITTTAFFPKRMVAYLLIWLVALIMLYSVKPSLTPDSLSYNFVDSIFRLSVYPFLGLLLIVVIVLLKITIFPAEDDPDRHLF